MEDNSYVSLSLEKYNELYDKAKKYDSLLNEYRDKVGDSIVKILNNISDMFNATDEEEPVEEELKVGDKVVVIGTIVAKDASDVPYKVKVNERVSLWFTKDEIKKI